MDSIIQALNPVQAEIVKDTEGYLLVLAGAGAGKTTVLTSRGAFLLENGIKPWEVLLVTFTNKAAREMRERLFHMVGSEARDVWVGTFHAICIRILARYGEEIGWPKFTIVNDRDQTKLFKECLEACGFDYDVDVVRGTISQAKNELLTPEDLAREAKASHERDIANLYQAYEDKKRELNYFDFDDLIMKTVQLLNVSDKALQHYQAQFRYVMADEGQDTNEAQFTLLDKLSGGHRNLFFVGDVDQGIYSWRGARITNIINFKKRYPDMKMYKLEQNYRSTQVIVEAANGVIGNNKIRLEKTAFTENRQGDPIIIYQADDDSREADFIASVIARTVQVDPKRSYKDFAILYRTNRQSRAIEVAFSQAGIRYQVLGGTRFYERKEILDLTAYLRIIDNEFDALAVSRIINVPRRGIGDTTVGKIQDYANDCGIPFPKALENIADIDSISKGTKTKIEGFVQMIHAFRQFAAQEGIGIHALVEHILATTDYRETYRTGKDDDEARLENIEELLNVAAAWDEENADGKTLSQFLTETTLVSDIDGMDDDDEVTLMTIHASKGLEFPVVFIAGMEENMFPHGRSVGNEEELEEERRLAYVAITRAKEKLFISHCKQRFEHNNPRPIFNKPSRFLAEIPKHLMRRV